MELTINHYSLELVKERESMYKSEGRFIYSPESAVDLVNSVLRLNRKSSERFVVVTLTTKNEIAGIHTVFTGSLNASICHPREVFQAALLNNAASIICFHNHPSGDPTPSREDVNITKRLKDAGELLGIGLLDHCIIAGNRFLSLKEKGYV